MKQRKPTLSPAVMALAVAAGLAAAMVIAILTADAANASYASQSAEKPYYSVDGHEYRDEHQLLMYLLSHPGHGDITQHQCIVIMENLKFKPCTLSTRHF